MPWGADIRQSPGALENVLYRLRDRLKERGACLISLRMSEGKGYRLLDPQVAHSS